MERIKNMSLKKAFFLFSFCGLLISLLFVLLVWYGCQKKMKEYPSGGISIDAEGMVTQLEEPDPEQQKVLRILSGISFLVSVLFPLIGLGMAGILFYRWKLKNAIALLLEGTERIRRRDLNFSFPAVSEDEMGQVCSAFESMRCELQKTNQELWRQNEERKRLNAAFAHDLRNPVTVLKGTARLLKENRQDEQAIERLETYTARLERYVDAMSSIQKLEQMPVREEEVSLPVLREELEETLRLLASDLEVKISGPGTGSVMLDHGIFLTVAENLIGNAVRFAKEKLEIVLTLEKDKVVLTAADDGPGLPDKLLKNGPKPFEKGADDGEHFGMGLYGSSLLCIKHGGNLCLENREGGGAKVTAVFKRYSESPQEGV